MPSPRDAVHIVFANEKVKPSDVEPTADVKQRLELRRQRETKLIENIASSQDSLKKLLEEANDHWGYEDGIYRFYHQSFKVFFLQQVTEQICSALQSLLPEQALNEWFLLIVKEGTGKTFDMEMNSKWLQETRPILEAFFHAKYFLEMVCRYSDQIHEPPQILPSGWASVLYLYNLR